MKSRKIIVKTQKLLKIKRKESIPHLIKIRCLLDYVNMKNMLQPLDMQMSVIEGYYDDGQEFTKTIPIYKETYTKDKHLLNIIRDLYDKQTILNAKYNVRIDKNMYDYI